MFLLKIEYLENMSSSSRPATGNSRPASSSNNANKVYPLVVEELKTRVIASATKRIEAFEMQDPKKSAPEPAVKEGERESWGGKLDFFLSALSYSGSLFFFF